MTEPTTTTQRFDPASTTRPAESLLHYYLMVSALTVVGFPFVFALLYCKYRTLHYSFDDKGVSMSWGVLFRKEIFLTYRRIQDIHVTRNLFHRWLGLANVAVQTASGSSGAEMTIEGIRNPEQLRDFLYSRMRGTEESQPKGEEHASTTESAEEESVTAVLRDIRDEVRSLREKLGESS